MTTTQQASLLKRRAGDGTHQWQSFWIRPKAAVMMVMVGAVEGGPATAAAAAAVRVVRAVRVAASGAAA